MNKAPEKKAPEKKAPGKKAPEKKIPEKKVQAKPEKAKIIFVGDPDDIIDEPKETKLNRKMAIIIAAAVVVLCIGLFTVASFAGIIHTFLTPSDKLEPETETTVEETSTEKETTTEKKTTTTEEETTEEYMPSQYVIDVNLAYNQVVVYTRGEKISDGYDPKDPHDDVYNLEPTVAFACSPGVESATPTGTYTLGDRSDWCFMVGDVYTQYATRITDAIMFHSVPYFSKNPGDLETYEYNILGYDASSGCIRLNCADASWIFYNCPEGTEVNIFYDWGYPSPIDTNPTYQIPDGVDEILKGWDPTDTYSFGNPWMTYTAGVTNSTVSLPMGSSTDQLIAAIGPTDEYGSNLIDCFYTEGGYDLWTTGTYTTTAHIDVANHEFSFPITINVTDEYSDDYYENYYNEFGDGYDYNDDDEYGYYDDWGNWVSYDPYEVDYSYESYYGGEYGYDAGGEYGEDSYDW